MPLTELIEHFLAWCREHRAPATAEFYAHGLRRLRETHADRPLGDLTPIEVEAWLTAAGRKADGSPVAPDTYRRNAIAFDRLQKWARERGEIRKLILKRIEKPAGRKRDRIPTAEEIAALVNGAREDFRLIYTALRLCGARPGELARATVADYDRELGAIVLKQHKTARKVGRPRVIPVGTRLAELVEQAIGGRTEGPIFLRRSGQPWTTNTISQQFRRQRDRAGLPKDLCLYLARHEHGTKLCAAAGIKAAAEALGHANIATTQRYVHVTTEELRRYQDAVQIDP